VRNRVLSVIVVGLAAWPAPSAQAAPRQVLRAQNNQVTAVGKWKIDQRYPRTTVGLNHAIRAFGQPSSRRRVSYYCRVTWRKLGIVARFTTLGAIPAGQTTCTPSVGLIDSLRITGAQWRTWEGLRIGAATDSILSHHKLAEFEFGRWTLARKFNPFGESPGMVPMVTAEVRGGRVVALRAEIGAQGE
jgi:hypothetical protein